MQRHLWMLVMLVASCKSKTTKTDPPPERGSNAGSNEGSNTGVPKPTPRTLQLADVPVPSDTPFELHNLKVMRVAYVKDGKLSDDTGDLELRVIVKPTGPLSGDARLSIVTTCRIHDVNLTFDEDRDVSSQIIHEAVLNKSGEVKSLFHADPFKELPKACEHVVRYRAQKTAPPVTVATVCYREDAVTVGACPATTFPPPAIDGAIAVSPTVSASFQDGSVGITGLFTLGAALSANEILGSAWRCSNGKAIARSEHDNVVFWTPGSMAAGTSAQGGLTTFLIEKIGVPERCELTVVARGPKGRSLGMFCVDKAGAVARGACVPKL